LREGNNSPVNKIVAVYVEDVGELVLPGVGAGAKMTYEALIPSLICYFETFT
jgi:hypothetical protein